jgi:UDP-2-acetamido-4-(D-alanylamino)-2,4,6-trideoxy-alpha-D-mannopyranose hydrolase
LKNWTKILLKPSDTLETTIQVLHAGGKRIALVVDEDKKLLGTVTDGDIRRALIKHVTMDCSVTEVMNSSPSTALASDQSNLIMSKIKSRDLLSIPLVNKHGTLVGLETLQHLLEKKRYDNPVFLMAGGFGTRLHPLTEIKPKPLLNVGNRPILETIINQFIEAGFHNFYISTHYKADMIREYFGDGANWGIKIEYLHEKIPLGTAGSLGLLPDNMPNLPIIMMNGDLLTKVNFEHLLDFHHQQTGLATMCIREYDFQVPYGVVTIEKQYVTGIVEKPTHKFFINAGIYVLDHKIINHVDGLTYIDMPNLLESQIENNEKVSVYPIHEYWLDIGRMDEFENAHQAFKSEFV